jgi:hypothetical protein
LRLEKAGKRISAFWPAATLCTFNGETRAVSVSRSSGGTTSAKVAPGAATAPMAPTLTTVSLASSKKLEKKPSAGSRDAFTMTGPPACRCSPWNSGDFRLALLSW